MKKLGGGIRLALAQYRELADETLFSSYSKALNHGPLKGKGILNYIGSHDDHDSFDRGRQNTYETAFKLMMAPGGVQIYYGDELARPMYAEGAFGDAQMRTFMNWQDLSKPETQDLLAHWQKLGTFRQAHPSVGAGSHKQLSATPYVFKRELAGKDKVVVASGLAKGQKSVSVKGVFKDGDTLYDFYSGQQITVVKGRATLNSDFSYLLLGKK